MANNIKSASTFVQKKQLYGNNFKGKKYIIVEQDSLSTYQNFLYNRALYGLKIYSEEEIKDMRWDKKKRIIKVHKRAQTILNVWKQQLVNIISTKLFLKYFPKSPYTTSMLDTVKDTDPEIVNKMSFKSLNISKNDIIQKLIKEGILPPNFYELKN